MTMMMMVVVLPVGRFSSHSSFAASLSLGGGSGYVQFDCLTTLHKSTATTLTDSDDVLLSDEDFPILLLSFVDLFCTHFQILLKSMRNNLVYNITFSIPEYACTPFLMLLLFVYLQLCGPQMLLIITQHIYGVHLTYIEMLFVMPFPETVNMTFFI